MKKLDLLIIKSYIGPLILTFSISMFVLLLQFLWKQLELLVGKGLETIIILKFLSYASATLVPMALPLSVLLASIMTMGNFGEKYELVAMKAAGISLWRILRPLIIVSILLAGFAFYFSNNLMPVVEMRMRTLQYEIKTKKPTVNIKPNEFYSEIDSYVIRIGDKDKEGKNLKDVIIYDHSKDIGNVSITKAKEGMMFTQDNGNTLVFILKNGYSYDESTTADNYYKNPLLRLYFKEQTIRFDISNFAFTKTDKDRYAGHYKMMNLTQLAANIDTIKMEKQDFRKVFLNNLNLKNKHKKDSNTYTTKNILPFYSALDTLSKEDKKKINKEVITNINSTKQEIDMLKTKEASDDEFIRRHEIEWHRKFTLSAACIILFFIGAPLGAIIRKGGLGMPVVISVLSFILYYVVGVIGEKSSLQASISIVLGMWSSTLVFLPIGLFLTMKATSDSALMNPEGWQKMFRKLKEKFKK